MGWSIGCRVIASLLPPSGVRAGPWVSSQDTVGCTPHICKGNRVEVCAGAGGVRGRQLPATRPCTSLPVLDVSLAHHTKTRIHMQCSDGIACLTRYMGRGADLDVSIETLWFTATCRHSHPYLDHDRL